MSMSSNAPGASIMIPLFNEKLYLEVCLKTLRQTFYAKEKYEIITVDDGSTDNSFQIASRYAGQVLLLR